MKSVLLSLGLGAVICILVLVIDLSRTRRLTEGVNSPEVQSKLLGLSHKELFSNLTVIDPEAVKEAYVKCLSLCVSAKRREKSWSAGPCLSSNLPMKRSQTGSPSTAAWGCDIAHCPRILVDNEKSNQCDKSHWIELDTDCTFLRFREGLKQDRQGVFCDSSGLKRIF